MAVELDKRGNPAAERIYVGNRLEAPRRPEASLPCQCSQDEGPGISLVVWIREPSTDKFACSVLTCDQTKDLEFFGNCDNPNFLPRK